MRKSKVKIKSLFHEPDDLRTYIINLKQVHSSTICDDYLNAIQGYEDFDDIASKISSITTDFGTEYTNKLHLVLNEHSSALNLY